MRDRHSNKRDKIRNRRHRSKLLNRHFYNMQKGGDPQPSLSLSNVANAVAPTSFMAPANNNPAPTPVQASPPPPPPVANNNNPPPAPVQQPQQPPVANNNNNPTPPPSPVQQPPQPPQPPVANNNNANPPSMEEMYSKLEELTGNIRKSGDIIPGLNISPFGLYQGNYSYPTTIEKTNTLYDYLLINPPVYALNCYQIMNIHTLYLPLHQKQFLRKVIEHICNGNIAHADIFFNIDANGNISGKLTSIWVIYYHPRFQGLVFGKQSGGEEKLVDFDLEKPEILFGNSFMCAPNSNPPANPSNPSDPANLNCQSTKMYGVYNTRVKALKISELPQYQQDWLINYLVIQHKKAEQPQELTSIAYIKDASNPSTELLWFDYYQDPSNNVPYFNFTALHSVDNRSSISDTLKNKMTAYVDQFPDLKSNVAQRIGDKTMLFFDWHPKQIAIMPLSPSQVYYPFDSVEAIRSLVAQKMQNRAPENNNGEFRSSELDEDRLGRLSNSLDKLVNQGSPVPPPPPGNNNNNNPPLMNNNNNNNNNPPPVAHPPRPSAPLSISEYDKLKTNNNNNQGNGNGNRNGNPNPNLAQQGVVNNNNNNNNQYSS